MFATLGTRPSTCQGSIFQFFQGPRRVLLHCGETKCYLPGSYAIRKICMHGVHTNAIWRNTFSKLFCKKRPSEKYTSPHAFSNLLTVDFVAPSSTNLRRASARSQMSKEPVHNILLQQKYFAKNTYKILQR